MFLDNEEHRAILLNIMSAVNFPGAHIDEMYALKKAIEKALVLPTPAEPAPAPKTDEPA